MPQYSVAIAGATGYAGQEMLRIIASHPNLQVTTVAGHSSVGDRLGDHAPNLRPFADLTITDISAQNLSGHDVVILALPHGASAELAEQLTNVPLIIDLGADHRLEQANAWKEFYGGEFHEHWTYGMPELITGMRVDGTFGRERTALQQASRIAGPGCNVTAVTLALQPGIAVDMIERTDIVADVVVGYSGAGKSLKRVNLLAAEAFGSAVPYAVGGVHRHIPEIAQNLAHAAGMDAQRAEDFRIGFTPILAPMARGILASVSAKLKPEWLQRSDEHIRAVWQRAYGDEHFISLLPEGQLPATANVVGSNAAHVQIVVDRRAGRLLALAAIDNLNRGTAGQAVQSLNIAMGLPEETGLTTIGVAP